MSINYITLGLILLTVFLFLIYETYLDFKYYKHYFIIYVRLILACAMICGGVMLLTFKKPKMQIIEPIQYEKPVVADTVKNDWANDSTKTIGKLYWLRNVEELSR